MKAVHIDFETRSTVDLRSTGAHVYAMHHSTEVMCFAYAIEDREPQIWLPGDAFPEELFDCLMDSSFIFKAHNAQFEFLIWNHVCVPNYGWPYLALEQLQCTMVMSYAMGLPGSLENAGAALGIAVQKDTKGRNIMLQLCKPKSIVGGKPIYVEDETKKEILQAYCKTDTIAEKQIDARVLKPGKFEREMWILDQRINNRGVYIDIESIRKILTLLAEEKIRLDKVIRDITKGFVKNTRDVKSLTQYVEFLGIETAGVGKAAVTKILNMPDIDDDLRNALSARKEASKTSTAKFQKMLDCMCQDGRIRGMFQFNGAHTGRWGGRMVQLQNLPRPKLKPYDIELILDTNLALDDVMMIGDPLQVLSDCIRAMLIASPGKKLIVADFTAIEAVVLAWLAGQENILNVFREDGSVYIAAASDIYSKAIEDISEDERQVGKTAVLALGFQGGVGAFTVMAKGYGVDMSSAYPALVKRATPEQIDWAELCYAGHEKVHKGTSELLSKETYIASELTKIFWRRSNPYIVGYWTDIEETAIEAVEHPGKAFKVTGPYATVTFKKSGSFLFCKLPSGRALVYPYPTIKETKTPWGSYKYLLHYKHVGLNKKWQETSTYGGKLVENITQAVARDLLAEAMVRCEEREYPVIMHVHDEIVTEVPRGTGTVKELEDIMSEVPNWALGMPISAKGWQGLRYRK